MSMYRRWPLVLGVLAAVVLIVGPWGSPALRDAETLHPVTDAHLVMSPAFLALAPLNNTFDTLSLLSLRQHIALVVTIAVVYAAWRLVPRRRRTVWGEWRAAAIALAVTVLVYAVAVLVPRPMAAIAMESGDAVAVDVHSHTSASHDGRRGFDLAANRAWHRNAGFDVAYISDHSRFLPSPSGGGPIVLGAVECIIRREHVIVLGVTAADSAALVRGRDCDATAAASRVVIETLPGDLEAIARGEPPVTAIEIADAAPRGLGQLDRDRARVLRLADSLDLAVVAGSDNHGWGWTAAAWSVLTVPGWRGMAPDSLGRAIEGTLRRQRRHAVTVIERTRPAAEAAIGPALLWSLVSTRTWPERVVWVIWLLSAAAIIAWRTRHAR